MPCSRQPGPVRILLLATLLGAVPPGRALLNIDGSRNQLFVFGGVTYNYSSNMFAEAVGRSDYTVSAQAGLELKRRAGIIAVNSIAKLDFVRYGQYTDQNALNPNFSLELNKTTGRTTGALTVSAYRETRSDSAVNLRTSSWNFPLNLSIKYPVNDKFYVTSGSGYLRRTYSDSQTTLVNYRDFSEAVDLYYVYTSKLDLIGGYRLRVATTSVEGRTVDHWFNVGATGGILAKMSGTIRAGYQFRNLSGTTGDKFDHFNAQAALNWPITRKVALALQLSRDFSTIATGHSVDSSSLALTGTYLYSRKIEFSGAISYGKNDFLGQIQSNRHDTFFSWTTGGQYKMNDHFQLGASYTYFRNWSTLGFSDFDSHGFMLDVSGRY
jgi:hypothetical protein